MKQQQKTGIVLLSSLFALLFFFVVSISSAAAYTETSGTCTCTDLLDCKEAYADNACTQIIPTSSINCLTLDECFNITRDITFSCNGNTLRNAFSAFGIGTTNLSLTIDGCVFEQTGTPSQSISRVIDTQGNYLHSLTLRNNTFSNVTEIFSANSTSLSLRSNIFRNITSSVVILDLRSVYGTITLDDNSITDSNFSTRIRAPSLIFTNNRQSGLGNGFGTDIFLDAQTLTLSGNTYTSTTNTQLQCPRSQSTYSNVTYLISGNTITSTTASSPISCHLGDKYASFEQNGSITIRQNTISSHSSSTPAIEGSIGAYSTAVIRENILSSSPNGIAFYSRDNTLNQKNLHILANTITSSSGNFSIEANAGTIESNTISASTGDAIRSNQDILFAQGSTLHIINNDITGGNANGVLVSAERGRTEYIQGNTISSVGLSAINTSGVEVVISQNTLSNVTVGIQGGSTLSLYGGEISQNVITNSTCGIYITSELSGARYNGSNSCSDGNPSFLCSGGGRCCDNGFGSCLDYCGDTLVQVPNSDGIMETCDDGNTNQFDSCFMNCTQNVCGDGIQDLANEECDDGNTNNGDGCNFLCQTEGFPATCGNGIPEGTEACDDGLTDPDDTVYGVGSDTLDDGVCVIDKSNPSASCQNNRCGDGYLNLLAESCDDGNQVSGDGCTSTCTLEITTTCGNSVNDVGEECDEGPMTDTSYSFNAFDDDGSCILDPYNASMQCLNYACGDGYLSILAGEECDDGNILGGDGCSATCTYEYTSVCGNDILDPNEECDDGIAGDTNFSNNPADDDGICVIDAGASYTCRINNCGDGYLYGQTEQCDDGGGADTLYTENEFDDDGSCISDVGNGNYCVYNTCGDGYLDIAFEECDDGFLFDTTSTLRSTDNDGSCVIDFRDPGASCKTNICGDGYLDSATEECDDGNLNNGDGCDSSCDLEGLYCPILCGDGKQDPGEACDDGDASDTFFLYIAGNDDGSCVIDNSRPFESCLDNVCGDGYLDVLGGEECDDNNRENNDGCDSNCLIESCGNGLMDPGEACDDGEINDTYFLAEASLDDGSCVIDFSQPSYRRCVDNVCGDGYLDIAGGEQCDDGNTRDGDSCGSTCQVEFCGDNICNFQENDTNCPTDCIVGCGDGFRNISAGEECDDGIYTDTNYSDNATDDDGYCVIDLNDLLNGCVLNVCGDGYLNASSETCDDGNTLSDDGCSDTCQIEFCGDSICQANETYINCPVDCISVLHNLSQNPVMPSQAYFLNNTTAYVQLNFTGQFGTIDDFYIRDNIGSCDDSYTGNVSNCDPVANNATLCSIFFPSNFNDFTVNQYFGCGKMDGQWYESVPGYLQVVQTCGDGICSLDEVSVCWTDCYPQCGDGICNATAGENSTQCPFDCPHCGNGICEPNYNETHITCPQDCAGPCGNGICEPGENATSCPADYPPVCGNFLCECDETNANCAVDCPSHCGNFVCEEELGETYFNCPVDCSNPCGNGICEPEYGENNITCPIDCPGGPCNLGDHIVDCPDGCGNGICDPGENSSICPRDCNTCGNGICEPAQNETYQTCEIDCPVPCGDGVCSFGEHPLSCPVDCPAPCGDGICGAGEDATVCGNDCFNTNITDTYAANECGDGYCSFGEDHRTCLADCPHPCGDGICGTGENQTSCAIDCVSDCSGGACCGDLVCDEGETSVSCAHDCLSSCGNTLCEASLGERYYTCPLDCPHPCGDGTCDASIGENTTTCPLDCTSITAGNLVCEMLQHPLICLPSSCPGDCPVKCGDGMCDASLGENNVTCPHDCHAPCGNGICEPGYGESSATCEVDCPLCGDSICNQLEFVGDCPGDCIDVNLNISDDSGNPTLVPYYSGKRINVSVDIAGSIVTNISSFYLSDFTGVCDDAQTSRAENTACLLMTNSSIICEILFDADFATFDTNLLYHGCVKSFGTWVRSDPHYIQVPSMCGDDVISGSETCDDGVNNGLPGRCLDCTQPCIIRNATVSLVDGNGNGLADPTELVEVYGEIHSTDCSAANLVQVDMTSGDSSCRLAFNPTANIGLSEMSGVTVGGLTINPGDTNFSGFWAIPAVPTPCHNVLVGATNASLYIGNPENPRASPMIPATGSFTLSDGSINLEAVCGNDIHEIGEMCDGFDDRNCPGVCTGSCDCPRCGAGERLCGDGICRENCNTLCNNDATCDIGEGCDCPDCDGLTDPCDNGLCSEGQCYVPTIPLCAQGERLCADRTGAGPYCRPSCGDNPLGDEDADGISNREDPDIDGDGIVDQFEHSIRLYPSSDFDGDFDLNIDDNDIDGDGILNSNDPDVNGDGVIDQFVDSILFPYENIDNDAFANINDSDIDGDAIPNRDDPDIDGDGDLDLFKYSINSPYSDIDNDGLRAIEDSDIDGDGISNGLDPDFVGDGTDSVYGERSCNYNLICDEHESCSCDDCHHDQDHCLPGLRCDGETRTCQPDIFGPRCPAGTRMCPDNVCRAVCQPELLCDFDDICDLDESCNCPDCDDHENYCQEGLRCINDLCNDPRESCPAGTTLCPDLVCRPDCTTSFGCDHQIPDGICSLTEACDCPDCLGEQSHCADGLRCNNDEVCEDIPDNETGPTCPPGYTLCADNICRLDCGQNERNCNYNTFCEPDESCACPDCEGKQDACQEGFICANGLCESEYCGDGTIDYERGEQCEDGNFDVTDSCVNCRFNYCGDGFRWNGYEDCDDGIFNGLNESFCSTTCENQGSLNITLSENLVQNKGDYDTSTTEYQYLVKYHIVDSDQADTAVMNPLPGEDRESNDDYLLPNDCLYSTKSGSSCTQFWYVKVDQVSDVEIFDLEEDLAIGEPTIASYEPSVEEYPVNPLGFFPQYEQRGESDQGPEFRTRIIPQYKGRIPSGEGVIRGPSNPGDMSSWSVSSNDTLSYHTRLNLAWRGNWRCESPFVRNDTTLSCDPPFTTPVNYSSRDLALNAAWERLSAKHCHINDLNINGPCAGTYTSDECDYNKNRLKCTDTITVEILSQGDMADLKLKNFHKNVASCSEVNKVEFCVSYASSPVPIQDCHIVLKRIGPPARYITLSNTCPPPDTHVERCFDVTDTVADDSSTFAWTCTDLLSNQDDIEVIFAMKRQDLTAEELSANQIPQGLNDPFTGVISIDSAYFIVDYIK